MAFHYDKKGDDHKLIHIQLLPHSKHHISKSISNQEAPMESHKEEYLLLSYYHIIILLFCHNVMHLIYFNIYNFVFII
jgi:hypothetical protein